MKRLVHLQWLCSIHVRTYFQECLFSLQREALSGHQSRSETWPYLGEDIKTKLKSCQPTSFYCWLVSSYIVWIQINFFSDSHLAPKFFKVVANSKKVCHHFLRQTKPFFYVVSALDRPSKIKSGKRSLTCYKVDTRMDDILYCTAFWT